MKTFYKFVTGVVLSCGLLAHAGTFEIVVPNPPGGTTDIVGRYVSKILNDANIPNVVQNKTGAQGTIGARTVAKTANKNSTLLILGTGPGLYAPLMMDPAPYNVQEDFEMIATIASDSIVIIVPGTSAIVSADDLVKKIKTSPEPLLYGHGAVSQKFAGIEFLHKINATATEVPFNGAPPAVLAVASGSLDFALVNYTEAKELATAGKIRIIGIASRTRPKDQSIKTFREQGIDFEAQAWFMLVAPKGVDTDIVHTLNQTVTRAIKQDRTSYVATEMTPMTGTAKDAKDFVDTQYRRYSAVIERVRSQSNKQ
jgi:tripartite-type tricarboxylate transporter receptor subunit TctC